MTGRSLEGEVTHPYDTERGYANIYLACKLVPNSGHALHNGACGGWNLGDVHMMAAGLGCQSAMVGTGWTDSHTKKKEFHFNPPFVIWVSGEWSYHTHEQLNVWIHWSSTQNTFQQSAFPAWLTFPHLHHKQVVWHFWCGWVILPFLTVNMHVCYFVIQMSKQMESLDGWEDCCNEVHILWSN